MRPWRQFSCPCGTSKAVGSGAGLVSFCLWAKKVNLGLLVSTSKNSSSSSSSATLGAFCFFAGEEDLDWEELINSAPLSVIDSCRFSSGVLARSIVSVGKFFFTIDCVKIV